MKHPEPLTNTKYLQSLVFLNIRSKGQLLHIITYILYTTNLQFFVSQPVRLRKQLINENSCLIFATSKLCDERHWKEREKCEKAGFKEKTHTHTHQTNSCCCDIKNKLEISEISFKAENVGLTLFPTSYFRRPLSNSISHCIDCKLV